MRIFATAAACLACLRLAAADPPTVAVVNGEPITLGAVEVELLHHEGAELVQDLVRRQLEATDWTKLADDDTVVQMGGWRLSRRMLAAQLLTNAAGVREDLINIALVRQALEREKVVVDQAAIDVEVARSQRLLDARLKAKGQPHVGLADFIAQTQKMTLEEFTAQPGYRMLTGLHLIAWRHAQRELGDDAVARWFTDHRADFDTSEAADLATIYIPFERAPGPEGKPVPTAESRERVATTMSQLHASLLAGRQTFAATFGMFSRAYEPYADATGRIGWVGRDGRRDNSSGRVLPRAVVDAAYAAQAPFPVLLPPIEHDDGIDLVQVRAHRLAHAAELADCRAQVVQDLFDSQLEARTTAVLNELKRSSRIDYQSLPELIRQRQEAAGMSGAKKVEALPGDPGDKANVPPREK